jgi:tetratricopeptide (TPR) repeat protein
MKKLLFITIFAFLFTCGCASRQQAVELYVDAVVLKDQNQPDKAVEKLNQAVRTDRRFSLAQSLLGEIYEQKGQYGKSATAYDAATRLNPWSFKDYFCLGRVYQAMKEYAQAFRAYSRATELKPDHFEANFNAAQCSYEINDYNNALKYGRKAAQIDSNIIELQQLLGHIYDSQKDYELSVGAYKRALEVNGSDANTIMSLAVAYLRTNRNEPAKELLTNVTRLQPSNSSGWQYLGYCYLRLDDVNQAISSYRKAIEINDQDWEAYRGLGVAYMIKATKDNDASLKAQAVELWRQSLSIKPDQPRRDRLIKLIERYSQ